MKQQNVTTVAIIIALGGFLFGYDIAMMSGTTSQLETQFNLNSTWLGFTIAILGTATNLLFTFVALFLIDRYGRRTLLMAGSVGMVLFLGMLFFPKPKENHWKKYRLNLRIKENLKSIISQYGN